MKTNLVFCLLISLMVDSYYLKGQDSTMAEIPTSFSIQVDGFLGYLRNDNTSLNRSLRMAGFAPFDENLVAAEGSIKFSINRPLIRRFVFALGISKYDVFATKEMDNYYSDMGGGSSELSIGYIILDRSNFRLYPYVGYNVNHAQISYTAHERDTTSIKNISEIVNVSKKVSVVNFSNQALDFGLFGERIFKSRTIGGCPRNVRYFSIGIKAGYLLKLRNSNNARYNFQLIPDGPNFGVGGPYVKVSVGYGIRFRKLKWK